MGLVDFRAGMAVGGTNGHIPDLVSKVLRAAAKDHILTGAVLQMSVLVRLQRRGLKGLFDIRPQRFQIECHFWIGCFDPGAVVPAVGAITDGFRGKIGFEERPVQSSQMWNTRT